MNEPWKHYAKWKKSDTKDQILSDSTYMKCPEQANLETERLAIAWGWGVEDVEDRMVRDY